MCAFERSEKGMDFIMKKSVVIITVIIVIVILEIAIFLILNNRENAVQNINNQGEEKQVQNVNEGNILDENNIEEGDNMDNQNENIKINLIVNNKTFSATLENNETTRELTAMLPLTLDMSDLNSNEKYNYLDTNLTTNGSRVNRINAGDIKLFGSNCLVVFYESFNTSYSYTNLGRVDNANDFVSELGSGSVTITFELAE